MVELVAKNLTVKAGERVLTEGASFSLAQGELIAMIGPNGAGKTSLLRAALGLAPFESGEVTLGGSAPAEMSPLVRASLVSYLPQTRSLAWPNIVHDVVALGRFAHGVSMGRLSGADAAAVDRALTACDLDDLRRRKTSTLSGGELARVHCARAIAAEAPLLVADEPAAALDPRHQFQIMDLIRRFVDNGGGALVVLHDINLATRYADRIVWMKNGRIIADGAPRATLTAERLSAVFGVRANVADAYVQIEGIDQT